MTKFCASLRFAELPALAELLANLGSTGRLRISHGAWSGEILVRRGQIIGASLDAERGRAALEGMAIGILDGEANFDDEPLSEDAEPLLDPTECAGILRRLSRERRHMVALIPSLRLVPRLAEVTDRRPTDERVTLVAVGAAALQIIPALAYGRTLEEIARERGLARTLRDIATLVAGNAVKLEAPAGTELPVASVPERSAPVAPTGAAAARLASATPVPPVAAHTPPLSARVIAARSGAARSTPGNASSTRPVESPPGRVIATRPRSAWTGRFAEAPVANAAHAPKQSQPMHSEQSEPSPPGSAHSATSAVTKPYLAARQDNVAAFGPVHGAARIERTLAPTTPPTSVPARHVMPSSTVRRRAIAWRDAVLRFLGDESAR